MKSFKEYIDKKTRKAKKQLEIVRQVLEKTGLLVKNHLEESDPYVYLQNPSKGTQFGGVRIYKIGNDICYRVQNEERTHPYGTAYPLEIEDMFGDLMSDDDYDEEKAGKEIMEGLAKELKGFFDKSTEAEKELKSRELEMQSDPLGKVTVSSTGTDYSNRVTGSGARL